MFEYFPTLTKVSTNKKPLNIYPLPAWMMHLLASLRLILERIVVPFIYQPLIIDSGIHIIVKISLCPRICKCPIVKLRKKFWHSGSGWNPARAGLSTCIQLAREPVPGKIWQMAPKCSIQPGPLLISGGWVVQISAQSQMCGWSSDLLSSDRDRTETTWPRQLISLSNIEGLLIITSQ